MRATDWDGDGRPWGIVERDSSGELVRVVVALWYLDDRASWRETLVHSAPLGNTFELVEFNTGKRWPL